MTALLALVVAVPFVMFIGGSVVLGISFAIADRLAGSEVGFRWLVGNAVGLAIAVAGILLLATLCFMMIVEATT